MDPPHLRELFRIFKETGGATVELLDSILDSPALKKSLGVHLRSIEAILHPPPAKTAVGMASPSSAAESTVKERPEAPTISEIRNGPGRYCWT